MDKKVPNHIAIIMDGNGRWAQKQGALRVIGHENGGERVKDLVETSDKAGVKFLTLYTFSTENWSRPKYEVQMIMKMLIKFLKREVPQLKKNNVVLNTIGRTKDLPDNVQETLRWGIEETKQNTGLTLTLALNYGSRPEIVDGINQIISDVKAGKLTEEITTDNFKDYLYDPELPDPDLLIRTAGEMRISNFLLWQISYSEIYISNELFPDFTGEKLLEAISEFQNRKRRFGGLVNK